MERFHNSYRKIMPNNEGCGIKAPFLTKQGLYLEVYHLFRLADGGLDNPSNVIALCPTCHRRAHYSAGAKDYNFELIKITETIENEIVVRMTASELRTP